MRLWAALFLFAALPLRAEEGMWPPEDLPLAAVEKSLGVKVDAAWLDGVRASTVRVNDEGSGSFVSGDGLVLTNHHVVADKLGERYKKGFSARSREEELPIDVQVLTPISAKDVSARVEAAMRGKGGARGAVERRGAEIAAIVEECAAAKETHCEVLKQSGGYRLYSYRSYGDVRLVFTPGADTAYFGGVPSDGAFPRFWLDTAFLRVYGDDGKPLKTPDFFPFRPGGAQNGEPVFTSGFPFATGRFNTEAQAKLERDLVNPAKLKENAAFRDALRSYAALGERQAGEVERDLDWREYMVHWHGRMQPILDDPAFLEGKRRDDAALRSGIAKLPEARRREFDGLLERADASTARIREGFAERTYRTLGDESKLAVLARDVLRYGRELGKPSERRSEGYDSDEALAKRRKEILEAEAGDPELERRLLQARLELAGRELGGRDPFVRATLDGCAAESAACRAVEGTRLADPAFREKLLDDGARAIRASRDPFLVLARAAQPYVDRAERWEESEAAAADDLARQLLAKARRAVQGAQAYPDANWSPRISYGRVEGWSDGWQDYPHRTTFFGLFDAARAADNKPPNRLDEAFERAVGRLDLGTPFNFLHSTDIASGNSGSAVIDRDRRLVGILFDSNRPAVADIYRYHRDGRTTSVDAAGILEALDKVYGMGWLARELTERAAPAAAAGRPSS